MKRFCLTFLFLGFITTLGMAQTSQVTSVNIVGYAKKTLPTNQWILVSCNFDKIGGGTNTLLDVYGTNQLTQNNNIMLCDRVVLWDVTGQVYQTWAQWTDGVFYKANDGAQWNNSIAGNPEVPAGIAMWVVPAAGASANKEITFMGEVISTATQAMNLVSGWQLVSYPLSSDIKLQDTDFFNDGAANNNNVMLCDRISVWEGNKYQTYALWTDGNWYKANDGSEWNNSILATNNISLVDGFWYVAQSNMVWSETNQYLSALQ